MREWWLNQYSEKYWLEVTGRDDLGANLKAPQSNEQGKEFWSYSLIQFVQAGDFIFHYYRPEQAIVAHSVATGDLWEDKLIWAARGSSARNAGIQPHTRSGWYAGLEKYTVLQNPVNLNDIRDYQIQLQKKRDELVAQVGKPLYFPFEMTDKRPLRPMQGYLFKLPSFFIKEFSQLDSSNIKFQLKENREDQLGADYRAADENAAVGQRDPFSVDPVLVERGLRSHAATQNALATYLETHGLQPRSPSPIEPNFDLGWVNDLVTWVAEIKSITEANEEKQLRLGLGQLLRYRHLLSSKGKVKAVLVIERQPKDTTWVNLCEELDIVLTWPSDWQKKLPI